MLWQARELRRDEESRCSLKLARSGKRVNDEWRSSLTDLQSATAAFGQARGKQGGQPDTVANELHQGDAGHPTEVVCQHGSEARPNRLPDNTVLGARLDAVANELH
jgi:hypothetical protein